MREKTLEYLKSKVEGFKLNKRGKVPIFTCPKCKADSCNFMGSTDKVFCLACNYKATLPDIMTLLEPNKTSEQISNDLGIEDPNREIYIHNALEFYRANGFDLVPVAKDSKKPVEKSWTTQNHTDMAEWERWLQMGLNFGVKTGSISQVTVLDFDTKDIPDDIKALLGDTLVQETAKGSHYFYKYTPALRKTRIEALKLDIETDGGQVVIYPSKVGGFARMIDWKPIAELPKELETKLLSYGNVSSKTNDFAKMIAEINSTEDLVSGESVNMVQEGGRNSTLLRFGGVLRKTLNPVQTETVLGLINSNFVSPRLPDREVKEIVRSLSKYAGLDEQVLAKKVYEYLKLVLECTSGDIKQALEENKKDIDTALAFLIKEGYAYRKGRNFVPIIKAEWDIGLTNLAKPIDFKMPYLHEVANLNWGDIILLGSATKGGKSTCCMNIIYELVQQNIKPYYIYLEAGSRFSTTALTLGLKEGDFYHKFSVDPVSVELEPNSVTIIDWLMCENKAETDIVFKKLVEKAEKASALLIVFMQVKPNGDWFAPSMTDLFVSVAGKYLYEPDSNGSRGYWDIKPIRDPKSHVKTATIPCQYDWKTKRLTMVQDTVDNSKPLKIVLPTKKPLDSDSNSAKIDSKVDFFADADTVTLK